MFRPNPATSKFSSERVSVFIRSMRLCNDGEISSIVVLIIIIIETVAGEEGGSVITEPHLLPSYGLNNSNNQNHNG